MTQKLSLHNEGVRKLSFINDTLHLELEHYDDATKTYIPYAVAFQGVQNLFVDDVPTRTIIQPNGDGDIIHFKQTGKKASLLVEWTDFANNKTQSTKLYEFDYASMKTPRKI